MSQRKASAGILAHIHSWDAPELRTIPRIKANAMNYYTDHQAFILANTYALNPPRKVGPARLRIENTGQYESDGHPEHVERFMRLCSWVDHTNVLVKYNSDELPQIE